MPPTRGLGVAMTDLTLAQDSINRGDLIAPFLACL